MIPILLASILSCSEAETKIQFVNQNNDLPASIKQEVIRAIIDVSPDECYPEYTQPHE